MTDLGERQYSYPVLRHFMLQGGGLGARVDIHVDGIAFRSYWGKMRACPWQHVREFYAQYMAYPATHKTLRTGKHTIAVPVDEDLRIVDEIEFKESFSLRHVANFRIISEDGMQMRIHGFVDTAPRKILNLIYDRIGKRLFHSACEKFATGTPVAFGEIEATSEGLRYGKRTLPWDKIKDLFSEHGLADEVQPDLVFNHLVLNKNLRHSWWQHCWYTMCVPGAGHGSERVANLKTLWKLVEHTCTSEPSESRDEVKHDVSSHPAARALESLNRRKVD